MLATAASVLIVSLGSAANAAVVHYPPMGTYINNFTFVIQGSGAPGIFNSSITPPEQYGIYNWCNMPHVRSAEYKKMPKGYTLEFVEVIQRHHKRTPYASNTFFKEDITWSCVGQGPIYGLKESKGPATDATDAQWRAYSNPLNPFTNTVGPGFVGSTCQFPQITGQGLEDSLAHGTDLRAVYAKPLGLSQQFDASVAQIRVTNNQITSQVASGLLKGLFPQSSDIEVLIQSSNFDSLEPAYSCPKASALQKAVTTGNSNWTNHLTATAGLYATLDAISGTPNQDTGGWHVSFDHYYDNMSAKQCHGKTLPCNINNTNQCVTQAEADRVYRLGNYEYSLQWRDAPESAQYAALKIGAWVLELKGHLQDKIEGKLKNMKYIHNIGHDGSISPLLGFLQIAEMVWPGMGSEVVFELYSSGTNSSNKTYFVRVLWGGRPMVTSTPLGTLNKVPIQDFFNYIDGMVGSSAQLLADCYSN